MKIKLKNCRMLEVMPFLEVLTQWQQFDKVWYVYIKYMQIIKKTAVFVTFIKVSGGKMEISSTFDQAIWLFVRQSVYWWAVIISLSLSLSVDMKTVDKAVLHFWSTFFVKYWPNFSFCGFSIISKNCFLLPQTLCILCHLWHIRKQKNKWINNKKKIYIYIS